MIELKNAEAVHASHPQTFGIPSRIDRETLIVGDFAKLMFVHANGNVERMWVKIRCPLSNGQYAGSIDNVPLLGDDWKLGDLIIFKPEHIISIQYGEA